MTSATAITIATTTTDTSVVIKRLAILITAEYGRLPGHNTGREGVA